MDTIDLSAEVAALGPWHLLIDVRDGITSADGPQMAHDGRKVSLINGQKFFKRLMNKIYPEGLSGKTFLDNGCNCGAYSFWAKDLAAERTFGYDVREHWIKQAEFLRTYRNSNTDNMQFVVSDIYDVPGVLALQSSKMFDVSWFSGVFYHLPDPISATKIVAEHTKEILFLNTAILTLFDEEQDNGCLYLWDEGKKHLMTGVHGVSWFPSGPKVLKGLLKSLGFPDARIVMWRRHVRKDERRTALRNKIGRIAIVAARQEGMLDGLYDVEPTNVATHQWTPVKQHSH